MDDLNKRIATLSPAKRALLELRLKREGASVAAGQTITPRINRQAKQVSARVSFAQERLWFLSQLEPESKSYNIPRLIRMTGALHLEALRQALNEIVRRHEPLRTRFALVDGTLTQVIERDALLPLPVIDLTHLPASEREIRSRELAKQEAERPFDLARGPVIRTSVLQLSADQQLLLLTTHHIVSDAWSAGILFRELGELYEAFSTGKPSPLAPLSIQYADFAEWQREWLQGEVLEEQTSYWRNQLADAPAILDLPTDRPRPAVQTFRGAWQSIALSKTVSEQLAELSQHEGATLFMTLLAAFTTLLWRYSAQDDIVVGTPIAGRNRSEIEELIGFFINTLVLRTHLSGNPSFRELLARVKETALGAYAHQDLPFEKLVEELQPERDLGRNPLFQVMFQFQNAPSSTLALRGLRLTTEGVGSGTAKFDLFLVAYESDGALQFLIEYSTDLFDAETIKRMLIRFSILLESIVSHPDERIGSLALMTAAEQRQLLIEWNNTRVAFPENDCIHQIFEKRVAQIPESVAVIFGDEQLTYRELNERANRVAYYLRKRGVGPEVLVGIRVERSAEMIVGLLGILKAGGAYVPLDASYPAERVAFILEDSQATVLLTQKHLLESLRSDHCDVVCLDADGREIAKENSANPAAGTTSRNAAHVIYTSGSTGKPKGVVGLHRASINRFEWMWRAYPFAPEEVCCQKTSLSFVDSIWEIFGPLLQGVPIVILPDEVVKDPRGFIESLSVNKVTRIVLVPSLLRVMLEDGSELFERLSRLKYWICSGETLPVDLAEAFHGKLPASLLINLYGSSEVAADVTCFEVRGTERLPSIPIGHPIANTQIYILDSNLQPLPVGIPGEIHVGGEGLARDYLNRPELTVEKFIDNPFSSRHGSRLYKTGDIGCFLPDGNIEYRGRRDYQVKIRGFRIELGEIEAALASHPQTRESVVTLRDDAAGDKRLIAYLVTDGKPLASAELRAYLRQRLPEYMLPSAFVMLDKFPLTASGKIDRLALPLPDADQLREKAKYVAPRTLTEEIIAAIWVSILGLEEIGINDDFFALGGHSLLLARVMSRVRDMLGVAVPMRVLFEASTVRGLAEKVESIRRAGEGLQDLPLIPIPREGAIPLSFAQERLWFFDQLEPGSAAYNIPRALRLKGKLDANALHQSVDTIVSRHEVLRTTFSSNNGRPVEMIANRGAVAVPVLDLSDVPEREREERASRMITQESQRPFDLARGPLMRTSLLRLSEEEHILMLTMHHIISDGWSMGVLFQELVGLYNDFTRRNRPVLPELRFQYADYAHWQRELLSGESLGKQLAYWRQQLGGAPAIIALPTDHARPEVRSFRGAKQSLAISRETMESLKKLARGERVTLFMTLLAAFQILLSWYTKDEDIVVGCPSAGRSQPGTETLIGYFVNTLVLRTNLSGDPELCEVLHRVRDVALGALAHQDVPFEKLVEELRPERTLKHNPLFQVWFVLQDAQWESPDFEGLTVESLGIDNQSTRHDLQLTLWETGSGLSGAFTHSTDLFDAETIAHMAEQFEGLLGAIVAQPVCRLSALRRILDEADEKYRNRKESDLQEAGRQKLKTVRRKVLTEVN
jgi:amino acid adenylation domain-containing protein